MPKFIPIDHDTPFLLPPDLRDWLPENHIAHFILEVVQTLDLSQAPLNHRNSGSPQYPPHTLLALLLYSYASGIFSSRQIERATHENIAARYIAANTHPDHDTLCTFRRKNAPLIRHAFSQLLQMAGHCGLLKVGNVNVAIDGTKILANASKHNAISYQHSQESLRQIEEEIDQLMAKADAADSTPLQDGHTIEGELALRHARKARIHQAQAEIQARAHVREHAEMEEYQEKVAHRQAQRDAGKKPRGREPQPPEEKGPRPKDQYNYTDPESRIMPTPQGMQQSYNAQAAVDIESRLIVGQRMSQAPNDKQQLKPTLEEAQKHVRVKTGLADNGYYSQKAIEEIERQEGSPTILAATKKQSHHKSVSDLEKSEDPAPPPPEAPFKEKMKHRTTTKEGKALYQKRQETIEPVFGIIKEAMGFRRFLMRGMEKVSNEWAIVCTAYNLRRLHVMGMKLG